MLVLQAARQLDPMAKLVYIASSRSANAYPFPMVLVAKG